jgi:SAM-dependent methyltransferase
MKRSALEFLVCPCCHHKLELEAHEEQGPEVVEGTLRSAGCGRAYPIVRAVPRFVDRQEYASSFGFQWNRFRTVQLDSFSGGHDSEELLAETTGWTDADYPGARVLDAGVGAGRFAEIAAAKGATVVGVDLTAAVDAAYANIGQRERVHIVQADIFALPFRKRTFDRAYSIGVLHHTPDPRAAFKCVADTVKEHGALAVYLYAAYGLQFRVSDLIRLVTTRLPVRAVLALSTVSIPFYYACRLPVLGRLFQLALPISMLPHWRWRWLDTFDWYSPTYQWKLRYPEVFSWFRSNGFASVHVADQPIRMAGVKVQ